MILSVYGVSFSYGRNEILKNIEFRVDGGEVVSILGENGSGKSTLLRTINRILKPHKGTVLIDGRAIRKMSRKEIAKTIGYMPQKSNGVYCNVFEAILLGRKPHIGWHISKKDMETVRLILAMMNLEKYAMRYTNELSGGELQKVILARVLAQEPQILLLDEPINHLDIKNQLEVMELLQNITKKMNLVSMVVMHDINTALRFSDKFLMIRDGEVVASGDKNIMNPENIRKVFNVDVIIEEISGIPVVVPA
jgi:iron complex transport system ATP-binding protein